MANNTLFSSKNLSLNFEVGDQQVTAVNDASITIPAKEITIIYGASGSGKSSLLNIISGLQKPTKGHLLYETTDIYSQTPNELAFFRGQKLGIVYQTNYWVKSLNVLENIALPQYFLGVQKSAAQSQAKQALEQVDMLKYANKYPSLLSGGEQQRVAMARAIVNDPPVIIADEPTGNLDSKNGDKIVSLLQNLNHEHGKTIILVTHNMEYISIASHLLEIEDGNVTEIVHSDIPKTVKKMLSSAQKRITDLMESQSRDQKK